MTSKPTSISTFAGGGGSSLGHKQAGFDVRWASEFIEEAARTYRANHPGTILDTRDIREVKPEEVLDAIGMDVGELDLMDGSPPCSAFSASGRGAEKWGKVSRYGNQYQRVDDLFFEYVRLLDGIQPKVFVAENVVGLTRGQAVGYFKMIHRALEAVGYTVKARVVNAAYLGVPQARERLIFVGVRKDLGLEPVHPKAQTEKPLPMSTVLGRSARLHVLGRTGWSVYPSSRPFPTIQARGVNGRHFDQACLTGVTPIDKDPDTGAPLPSPYAPVKEYLPNTYKRRVSIPELKALSGFPDDYVFTGIYNHRWERIGRAVPPPMMRAVAETIKREILCVD